MLYNSKMHLFRWKLKSKWSRPFKITEVLANGVVEVENYKAEKFKINGQLKKYYGKPLDVWVVNVMYINEV